MNLYLDNAATSYPKPESVYQAVTDSMRTVGASPGRGGYRQSLDASRLLFAAREAAARLFAIDDASRVIFTHNATEALNLALRGTLGKGDHVVTSSLEHNSMIRTLHWLQRQVGIDLTIVPADGNGYLDPADIRNALTSRTSMIAITHVSNVCGTIQPLQEIARVAQQAEALFLVDAAQSAGAIPLDVNQLGIDLLAVPGHKGLYGPPGTGLLYTAPRVSLRPLLFGGTGTSSSQTEQPTIMPEGFEAGTHNLPGIAGLKAGIEFVLSTGVENIGKHEQRLTTQLAARLADSTAITLHGYSDSCRHNGVLSLTIAGRDAAAVAFELDQRFGIAVRSGLHCAPGAHRTLGTFPEGTVRISPGWFTSDEDIAFVADAIVQCIP